jgi:hypothetical protein
VYVLPRLARGPVYGRVYRQHCCSVG